MIPHRGQIERGERHQRERERAHIAASSLLLIWLWGLSHGSELLPVHVASFWTRTPGMSCCDSPQITIPPCWPRYVLNSLHCKVPGSLQRKIDETPSLLFLWPATHGYTWYVIHTLSTNLHRAYFMSLPPCVPSGLAQGIYSWQCTWQWPIQAFPYRSDIAAIPLKQQVFAKR